MRFCEVEKWRLSRAGRQKQENHLDTLRVKGHSLSEGAFCRSHRLEVTSLVQR